MPRILHLALVLALSLSSSRADAQEPAVTPKTTSTPRTLTQAGNGEPIGDPSVRLSTSVRDGDRTIEIPAGMVLIPAGAATVGEGADRRTVNLPAFGIGKFSITNAEYQAFVRATNHRAPRYWTGGTFPEGKANHPVAYVSLDDAHAYAAWVSHETGWPIAVPTADQWEKAARGPRGTLYPWGDSPETQFERGELTTRFNYNALMVAPLLRDKPDQEVTYSDPQSQLHGTKVALNKVTAVDASGRSTLLSITPSGSVRGWISHSTNTGFTGTDLFKASNARGGNTTPVGAYEAGRSAYGAYDMAGNIWNWTETTIVARNGVEKGKSVNEIRGGSWYSGARSCRATTIGEGRAASGHYNTVGFRIIMTPPPTAP